MPTSLAHLLDGIRPLTAGPIVTAADADSAVAALGHLSRALDRLTNDHQQGETVTLPRRRLATCELAATCRTVSAQWPTATGRRLVDLAAAAADVIGRTAQRMDTDERWAVAIEIATAARRCTQFATRFAPYRDLPGLRRVSRLTDVMRQFAALDPPDVLARACLDAPVASRSVSLDTATGPAADDAAAGLLLALVHGTRDGILTMRGVLAASAAAESCSEHASSLASALGGQTRWRSPWSHATDSWRVVQAALIRFDDGSRFASPATSNVTEHAVALHQAGTALTTDGSLPPAESATALRYVANQLPAIAGQIGIAVARWADTGRLVARARSLPRSEERVPELIHDQAVVVRRPDTGAVLISTRVAERLSSALAVELHRSAAYLGEQPQPRLNRALAAVAHLPNIVRDARWADDLAIRVGARSTAPAR